MAFRIPDVLRYEIRHRMESLCGAGTGGGPREWINEHPLLIAGVAGLSMVLVGVVLVLALRPASDIARMQARTVWFCDVNTGKLFEGSPKKAGPIAAPSGPASNGEPAGFRAHVYSYVLDPNEAELFVGFLERPDPEAQKAFSASDMRDFGKWVRGHLIRRPRDQEWVPAAGHEGQAILREMIQPNKQGQTPIYQVPNDKE
ncbi:MAG: hypothetical protein ABFD90_10440 [Phycisphaerales bacterium]